jgi:hypothetical protein
MAQVVVAHGVGQQYVGAAYLRERWLRAMLDGLERAGYPDPSGLDVNYAFYGDLFRPLDKGSIPSKRGLPVKAPAVSKRKPQRDQQSYQSLADTGDDLEADILRAWDRHSAELDPPTRKQRNETLRQPLPMRLLSLLFGSTFLANVAQWSLPGDARQISIYLQDQALRASARERIVQAIDRDTRVLVGFSLGAVVAYETLCLNPTLPVTTFVTIGCPLGIRGLIFDRLEPSPRDGLGEWPVGIQVWHNVVDPRDVVALGRPLRPLFGPGNIHDHLVDNGDRPHDFERYLSSPDAGLSIASGLEG